MEKAEEAVRRFRSGLNCSQAVLAAFAADVGIDEALAVRAASAFGGGMGCSAQTCGAVTGALMAIGFRHGSGSRKDLEKTYGKTKDFMRRFVSKLGSTECSDLLDCDISTKEGMDRALGEGLFKNLCPEFVEEAARILDDVL